MVGWVRLWQDMPTDPKWRVIARKSDQPVTAVISVFAMMLVNASANAGERGILAGWVNEDVAAALDIGEADVAAIFEAMQGKVLDGYRLTGWERRQPSREDDSLMRVRRHREKKKRSVTPGNAPDSDSDSDSEEGEGEKSANSTLSLADAIVEWNAMAAKAGVPVVKSLTERRRELFYQRAAEHGEGAVLNAIAAVGQSEFCRGKNERSWRADFTFMLQPENFVKLIEGGFGPSLQQGNEKSLSKEPETRAELERAIEMNLRYDNPKTVEKYRRMLDAVCS